MKGFKTYRTLFLFTALIAVISTTQYSVADDAESAVKAATNAATANRYQLRYKFREGDEIRIKVVQLVSMNTKIQGTEESVRSRSEAIKYLKVQSVDELGNITLDHQVERANMWQKISGQDEVRYDSTSDGPVPAQYESLDKRIGKPLTTVKITPSGSMLDRKDHILTYNPGIGLLLPPLPEGEVAIGHKWYMPDQTRVRLKDGRVKTILLRKHYTLEKVENGLATIKQRTQILTPITDAKIKSQVIQRIQHGYLKFDIEAGRLFNSRLELDERVIGFNGPTSHMHYLGRLTEQSELVRDGVRKVSVR